MLLFAIRRGRPRHTAFAMLAGVMAVLTLAGVTWPLNHAAQQHAVAAAKAYPKRVGPLLEAYRQAHGSYPNSLDQLPGKPTVPRLLLHSYGYRSDGSSYSFCFTEPGALIDDWNYESTTKDWYRDS